MNWRGIGDSFSSSPSCTVWNSFIRPAMRGSWQTRVLRVWTTKLHRPGRVPVKISFTVVTERCRTFRKTHISKKRKKAVPRPFRGRLFLTFIIMHSFKFTRITKNPAFTAGFSFIKVYFFAGSFLPPTLSSSSPFTEKIRGFRNYFQIFFAFKKVHFLEMAGSAAGKEAGIWRRTRR